MSVTRWLILIFVLIVLFLINLMLGSVHIPVSDILNILFAKPAAQSSWTTIIWEFRLTKAFTCILGGGALAVGGLQMQTLFRNALAGPDVLGLSSGASLAVALLLLAQSAGVTLPSAVGNWSVAIASSIGCAAVLLVMLVISRHLADNVSLLLVGLMIGAATSSIVSVLQYLSRAEDLQLYMIWTFGSLGNLSWTEIRVLAIILTVGSTLALISSKALNAWMLGENYARSLGINISRSRLLVIFGTSILTGAVTAFCGPIAFVGLAVPHLVKLLIRSSNHMVLIPAVLIGGAALMLLCDIISQLPRAAQVLPINAITALIGAPVVIWIILKSKKVSS